jgi:hypothetical protein
LQRILQVASLDALTSRQGRDRTRQLQRPALSTIRKLWPVHRRLLEKWIFHFPLAPVLTATPAIWGGCQCVQGDLNLSLE